MRMMTPSTRPSRLLELEAATKPVVRRPETAPPPHQGGLASSSSERGRRSLSCRSAGGTTRTTSTRGWVRRHDGMLDEAPVVYEPVCDATGVSEEAGRAAGRSRVGRPRAAAAKEGGLCDLAVSARKALVIGRGRGVRGRRHVHAMDDFHQLCRCCWEDRDTILQTEGRSRRVVFVAKGAGGRRQNALMEADQFIELFDKAHIGCQARHVRAAVARACRAAGLPQPRGALGERDWASPAALLELCRGGPLNARRSKLVSGVRPADEAPRRAIITSNDRVAAGRAVQSRRRRAPGLPRGRRRARARVSIDTFRAVFEDLSSGIEGDFASRSSANCGTWRPGRGRDAVEEEGVNSS